MSFNHNFSKELLAINEPVTIKLLNDTNSSVLTSFQLRYPTLKEMYSSYPVQFLTGILSADIEELQKQFIFIPDLATHFQLFNTILSLSNEYPQLSHYVENIVNGFNLLSVPLKAEKTYYTINSIQLTFDLFQFFRQTILESMCQKINDAYAAIDSRYAEAEKKINKIKKSQINARSGDLMATIASIIHEFHLSIEEIKNLNFYQFSRLARYVPKIVNYNITTIAAGNGLTKKIHYFTEGGKK